jgi:hypothetical protein
LSLSGVSPGGVHERAGGPELDAFLTDKDGTRRFVSLPAGFVPEDRIAALRDAAGRGRQARAGAPGARAVALGRQLVERARRAGRAAQFDRTLRAGDPLPFGLYEPGDSVMRLP